MRVHIILKGVVNYDIQGGQISRREKNFSVKNKMSKNGKPL